MVQWLLALPKNIFVILVLGVAIIFIVAQDPPHTICRTQIENFKSRQKGIIYKDPNIKTRQKPLLAVLIKQCKEYNSPGSCYGLFSRIKIFIHDFKLVSSDCSNSFSSISEVRSTLFELYDLMIRLAWGDNAPATEHHNNLNWFSDLDIALFCLLKERMLSFYGKDSLLSLEQKVFAKLPNAKGMSKSRIRDLAIVSVNCSLYPPI